MDIIRNSTQAKQICYLNDGDVFRIKSEDKQILYIKSDASFIGYKVVVVNLKTGHVEDISCDTLVIPVSGVFVENYKGGSVDEIN